jgi:hypothetical protein
MNKGLRIQLLGILMGVVGLVGGTISATLDQPEQRQVTPDGRVSRNMAAPKVTEDLIKTVVRAGEWECLERKSDGAWEKAFKLKLSPDELKAVTPTGPILPIEGNPASFNGAMASYDSGIYSKFGFWDVFSDVMILKLYAAWHEDPASSRAMARALMGANRYPSEVNVDSAIIDNLERGITIVDIKSNNFMNDSFEIKILAIEHAHFSGRIRRIRHHSPAGTGIRAFEYEPVSGKIRRIRPSAASATGVRAGEYHRIRCDRLVK